MEMKEKRKSQFYENLMQEKGKIIYYLVKDKHYTWQQIADLTNNDIRNIYEKLPTYIQKSISNYYNLCYDMIKSSSFVFYSLRGRDKSTPKGIRTYMQRYCKKFNKPFPEEVRINNTVHFTPNNFLAMNERFFKVTQLDKRENSEKELIKLPKVKETYKGFFKQKVTKDISVSVAQKEIIIELSRCTDYKVSDMLDMRIYDIMQFFDNFSDEAKGFVQIVLDEFDANKLKYNSNTFFFMTFGTRYGTPHKIMKSSLSMFFSYAYEKYGYMREDNRIIVK